MSSLNVAQLERIAAVFNAIAVDVLDALARADRELGTYGVETIENASYRTVLFYLNTGETYDATLLYDVEASTFRVGSWGDWVETYEMNGGAVR